ncbi:MAG: zinc-binding alcohol dehydrogenase family protein [Brevinema sp.]
MKAINVPHKKTIEIIDSISPTLQKNEVKVKMKYTGICGSDIHFYHGTLPVAQYPRIIGHEGVGEIIALGSDVTKFKIGDIVVGEPLKACGECYSCKNGRPNACFTMKSRGCHVDGCFREETSYPEISVHKVPSSIALKDAALIEPYSIAAQVCYRTRVQKGDIFWVMGAGPIGLTIIDVAKNVYSAIVIATDLVDSRLELAKKLGADYTFNANLPNLEEEIKKITGGFGPNIIADAVCIPQTFAQAIRMAAPAGRVASLSFSPDLAQISALDITKKELDIVGCRHQTFRFPEVIKWFENKQVHPELLISHVFPFDQVKEGIALMENSPNQCCKILLDWTL